MGSGRFRCGRAAEDLAASDNRTVRSQGKSQARRGVPGIVSLSSDSQLRDSFSRLASAEAATGCGTQSPSSGIDGRRVVSVARWRSQPISARHSSPRPPAPQWLHRSARFTGGSKTLLLHTGSTELGSSLLTPHPIPTSSRARGAASPMSPSLSAPAGSEVRLLPCERSVGLSDCGNSQQRAVADPLAKRALLGRRPRQRPPAQKRPGATAVDRLALPEQYGAPRATMTPKPSSRLSPGWSTRISSPVTIRPSLRMSACRPPRWTSGRRIGSASSSARQRRLTETATAMLPGRCGRGCLRNRSSAARST